MKKPEIVSVLKQKYWQIRMICRKLKIKENKTNLKAENLASFDKSRH